MGMRTFTFKADEKLINRFTLMCLQEGYYSFSECLRNLIITYMERKNIEPRSIRVKRVVLT
ncbi:MAG: hypothetical protein QN229_07405 [Desulfurococcaceae archaeon TW002]